jgi:GNAT superfamily N-acetyltransferase
MTIRTAEISEAAELAVLINAAFLVEKFFVDGDRIDTDQVRDLFPKGAFLVLDGEHSLDACVYVEQRGDRAYFGLLSIDPGRQRSGLGSRLVKAAEYWARERGCGHLDMRTVNLRDELPAFYGRLGYVETGTDPFTPETPTKLPCHFVNFSKALS